MDYGADVETHRRDQGRCDDRRLARHAARRPRRFGIMRIDDSGRVVGFLEKPKTEEDVAPGAHRSRLDRRPRHRQPRPRLPGQHGHLSVQSRDAGRPAGQDRLPRLRQGNLSAVDPATRVQVHLFDGYWEDIGTIRSFYEANLELADVRSAVRIDSASGPIYTHARSCLPLASTGPRSANQPAGRRLRDRRAPSSKTASSACAARSAGTGDSQFDLDGGRLLRARGSARRRRC